MGGKPLVNEVKINKWDCCAVKNALDDAVREILTSKMNYIEDNTLMDGRLVISGIAVAVAVFALLYDYLYPFPESRTALIVSVIVHFFTMFVLTLYVNYIEKGIFVRTIQRDPLGHDPDIYWEASSYLRKYDDMYTLVLSPKQNNTHKALQATIIRSVANFFDEDGVLVFDQLELEIVKLHNSLTLYVKNN